MAKAALILRAVHHDQTRKWCGQSSVFDGLDLSDRIQKYELLTTATLTLEICSVASVPFLWGDALRDLQG